MSFNEYLDQDYNALMKAADKITGNNDLSVDLLHYAIEELSYKDNLQSILDSGGTRFYLVCIMSTQWRSKTGPFYRHFIKSNNTIEHLEIIEPEESQIDTKRINLLLNKLNWYDRELWKLYAEGGHNYSSLSRETGIPRTSIGLTIKRVRAYLKQNL